ncbi:MAG: hypothetical protein J0J01_08990 [Reyranella sp.]|uniref:hypothetical protein n=1 Tax=Reyranella sp. TaxID=1929291 RepID=UPI001ACF4BBE|nr:hypothetical protein [Reyranella sp.]MBN9087029.1 hypothetical protein [Reyranella sp.]
MDTTETSTVPPPLTASLLADALAALARAVEVRCLGTTEGTAFSTALEEAAAEFGTTPGLALLAFDQLAKGRRVLNATALLGLVEGNRALLDLGRRYAAAQASLNSQGTPHV